MITNKALILSFIQKIRTKDRDLADILELLLDGLVANDLDNVSLLERIDAETKLLKYAARVTNSTATTLTTAIAATLAFNTDRWNYGHLHDEVTNNTRLIALEDGRYTVGCHAAFAANATGNRRLRIIKTKLSGATEIIGSDLRLGTATNNTRICFEITEDFLRGEYCELEAFQTSGGNLDVIITSGENYPDFWMQGISVLENQ